MSAAELPLDDEWTRLFAELCAAYDRPMTDLRRSAYRKSLGKMSIGSWGAVVEFCIGEKGPERFPSAGECWRIYRSLRARSRPGADADAGPTYSSWAITANRVLMRCAYGMSGGRLRPIAEYPPMPAGGYGLPLRLPIATDRARLDAVFAVKAEIVAEAEGAERAGDPWERADFVDMIESAFRRSLSAAA